MTTPRYARLAALAGALCGLVLAAPSLADAPEAITYQGLLTDGAGVVVPDGSYSVTFRIFDVAELGSEIWDQTLDVAVKDGLYNVILSDPGLAAAFQPTQTYMELTINSGPVGGPITLSPRQQITSVPYALNASAAPPAIIDAARKTDVQVVTTGSSPEILEVTGGGGTLVAELTIPEGSYAVTVLAKVLVQIEEGSGTTLVTIELREDCGGGPVTVDTAFDRRPGTPATQATVSLAYFNLAPTSGTCSYSLRASTNLDDLAINAPGGAATSIIARADPI